MRWIINLFILCLTFFQNSCNPCYLDEQVLKNEAQHAYISCQPEIQYPDSTVDSHGVCIFTCKRNAIKFKHFCGTFGHWDVDPGSKSCSQFDLADNNVGNDPCPSLDFNSENGWLSCKSMTKQKKVIQTCLLNCDPGFKAAPSEMFLCHAEDKTWKHLNGNVITNQNISCQPSVAIISDGQEIELYHPIKKFNPASLPNFPMFLQDILGFWMQGQLVFCGQNLGWVKFFKFHVMTFFILFPKKWPFSALRRIPNLHSARCALR